MRIAVALLLLTLSPGVACARANKQTRPELRTALRDDRLNATLWVQKSAEFRANVEQAYSVARLRLDDALADPDAWPQVLTEGPSNRNATPAIIVDVDETVLDNSPHQGSEIVAGVHMHDETRWADRWVKKEAAAAYPAALNFVQYAASRGVKVFYVTNRSQLAETSSNLRKVGFPVDEGAVLVPTSGSDKSSRRAVVAANHHVLLLIGDDLGDFVSYKMSDSPEAKPRDMTSEERMKLVVTHASHFGRDWIIIPNPIYGSWERALYPGAKDPVDVNLRKREALQLSQ